MNMKLLKVKADSRSGVTLVELLVVILIVTILAVALLPLLQPFIVKAQYAAEPIPVLGNVRTSVGMYAFENSVLPGTIVTANITGLNAADIANPATQRSSIIDNILSADGIQTFKSFVNTDTDSEGFVRCVMGDATAIAKGADGWPKGVGTADVDHFAKQLDINYQELTGSKFRPNDVQYIVPYQDGSAQIYAIGAFGSGGSGKLPAGTGYAILEIVDPTNSRKILATWSRYKPVGNKPVQIKFVGPNDATYTTAAGCEDKDVVWVPGASYIGNGANIDQLEVDLKVAGWKFASAN